MATDSSPASQRAALTSERERISEQLAQLGTDGTNLDENFADSGQVTAERGELEALSGSLLETLQEIDRALAKFDSNTYGKCEDCGDDIALARLEVMPAARYCITCAADH